MPSKGKAEGKRRTGRPSKYTPELAAELCERMGNGESLRSICESEHMPSVSQAISWALGNVAEPARLA